MPTYIYRCDRCEIEAEVIHGMREDPKIRCSCRKRMHRVPACTAIKGAPDSGWENENRGKGRYISQLQSNPGPAGSDPNAFCRSQAEVITKAKALGLNAVRAR